MKYHDYPAMIVNDYIWFQLHNENYVGNILHQGTICVKVS